MDKQNVFQKIYQLPQFTRNFMDVFYNILVQKQENN